MDRKLRKQIRKDIHDRLKIPAVYFSPAEPENAISVFIRLHTKFSAIGSDPVSSRGDFAARENLEPKIIFWVSEVPVPRRAYVVSVAPGEAYSIQSTEPPDGDTVTAAASRLSLKETLDFPVPADVS